MDLEIVERVPAQVEREGRTTAPAHTLYDIVRKLRDGAQIEIETSGERNAMVLRSGRSTFTLACLPPEDYPLMSSGELPYNFSLSATELRTLIDRTRFAISTEETRYYLNGIYLHATKADEVPVIRAVATDGHRLARMEMVSARGRRRYARRDRAAQDRHRVAASWSTRRGEVQIGLGDTKIRFAIGEAALTSKLIDGTFPDYDRVIPTGNDKMLEVDVQRFRRGGRPGLDDLDREQPGGEAEDRHAAIWRFGDQPGKRHRRSRSSRSVTARPRNRLQFALSVDIAEQIEGDGAQFAMSDAARRPSCATATIAAPFTC